MELIWCWENGWFLAPIHYSIWYALSLHESDQTKNCCISGLVLPNPHFLDLTDSKSDYPQSFSSRRNAASPTLLYGYFHSKRSNELHSSIPPVRITLMKRNFYSKIFFPRNGTLLIRLSRVCFFDHYDIDLFLLYLSYI